MANEIVNPALRVRRQQASDTCQKAIKSLSSKEYAVTSRKKRADTKKASNILSSPRIAKDGEAPQMSLTEGEKKRLKKVGLTGLNKEENAEHPTKKGVVAVRDGKKMKIIRFGDQKMGHNYSPEARKAFKSDMLRTSRRASYSALS